MYAPALAINTNSESAFVSSLPTVLNPTLPNELKSSF